MQSEGQAPLIQRVKDSPLLLSSKTRSSKLLVVDVCCTPAFHPYLGSWYTCVSVSCLVCCDLSNWFCGPLKKEEEEAGKRSHNPLLAEKRLKAGSRTHRMRGEGENVNSADIMMIMMMMMLMVVVIVVVHRKSLHLTLSLFLSSLSACLLCSALV